MSFSLILLVFPMKVCSLYIYIVFNCFISSYLTSDNALSNSVQVVEIHRRIHELIFWVKDLLLFQVNDHFVGEVYCVCIDPVHCILAASGGKDDRAFVWNINDGQVLFECSGSTLSKFYYLVFRHICSHYTHMRSCISGIGLHETEWALTYLL